MKKIEYKDFDIEKSIQRLKKIAIEINDIMNVVGPGLIKLSHLRNESRLIIECLNNSQNGLKDQK